MEAAGCKSWGSPWLLHPSSASSGPGHSPGNRIGFRGQSPLPKEMEGRNQYALHRCGIGGGCHLSLPLLAFVQIQLSQYIDAVWLGQLYWYIILPRHFLPVEVQSIRSDLECRISFCTYWGMWSCPGDTSNHHNSTKVVMGEGERGKEPVVCGVCFLVDFKRAKAIHSFKIATPAWAGGGACF